MGVSGKMNVEMLKFWRSKDPRVYQIAVLGILLGYGLVHFDLGLAPGFCALALATTLGVQGLCSWAFRLPGFDPRSPLISGLSLCLLLRTNSAWVVVFAGVVAIASKFLLRCKRRHFFNPTNFGIVVAVLVTNAAWISPGQWGSGVWKMFFFGCAGMLVLYRTARSDVTWAFLGFWALLVFGRAWYLGDPWSIPLRQMQSGSLLLFAFFMISDPKTTPDSRVGRILFAGLVAGVAALLQLNWFTWYKVGVLGVVWELDWISLRANGMFYALVLGCCTTPLINRWLPGRAYEWPGRKRAADVVAAQIFPNPEPRKVNP